MVTMKLHLSLTNEDSRKLILLCELQEMNAAQFIQFGMIVRRGIKVIEVEIDNMPNMGPNPNLN